MTRIRPSKRTFVKNSDDQLDVPNKKRSRTKVPCPCNKCKGKLVDPRTKTSHELKNNQGSSQDDRMVIGSSQDDRMEIETLSSDNDEIEEIGKPERLPLDQEEKYLFLTKKIPKDRSKGKGKQKATVGRIGQNPIVLIDQIIMSDYEEDDDDEDNHDQGDNNNFGEEEEEEEEEYASGFDAPENIYDDDDPSAPIVDFNEGYNWIVLWILLYQERHRLSDVATHSLVKFVRYILILLDSNADFPISLYMARKKLGVCAHIIKYAACEKCCRLYNVTEVSSNIPDQVPTTIHCNYVDFPNHPMENQRESCNAKLAKIIPTKDRIIYRPSTIFPTINLKHQLQSMYNRKGFEELCRKWADRRDDARY